ncbi:hypothetical protein KZ483_07035 [Paenibacillus sp. sptzw28]|uniref:hypothetical protein n=1 Tax=Paenibacillus sp. sptzw28 TaxID=715179 RepID=UPI001C6F2764|nr:hypothetical protein [Paenibacillus sp. sptzw28]QYR22695.1 hypothetical protein KZ483_07035 [Paenibacillus sp. sptzw28]
MKIRMVCDRSQLRLTAALALSALVVFAAGCESEADKKEKLVLEASQVMDKLPEETAEKSQAVAPQMEPASEAEPNLYAAAGSPVQPDEQTKTEIIYDAAEWTYDQLRAIVAKEFDHFVYISGKESVAEFAVINDEEVLVKYEQEEMEAVTATIRRYNLKKGTSVVLWTGKGRTAMKYNVRTRLIELTDRPVQTEHIINYTLSPETGKLDRNPELELAAGSRWTLYRVNGEPGIWAKSNDGKTKLHLTDKPEDHSPLWIPGTESFIYLHQTGRSLGDGLGSEFALARYDLSKRSMTLLPFDHGYIRIIGWTDHGRKLLIDRTLNEGSDRNYTNPALIDLTHNKERQLLPDGMGAYDLSYNGALGEFLVSIPKYTAVYGSDGHIRSLFPDDRERSDLATAFRSFSPDGRRLAYVSGTVAYSDRDATPGSRIILSDSDGSDQRYATREFMRVEQLTWSPTGQSLTALVHDDKGGTFIVTKKIPK